MPAVNNIVNIQDVTKSLGLYNRHRVVAFLIVATLPSGHWFLVRGVCQCSFFIVKLLK